MPGESAASHEYQLFYAWHQTLQCINGFRALQREQAAVGHVDDFAAVANALLHVGQVVGFACAIDDEKQMVATIDEHQVIQNCAFVAQKQAVALFVYFKAKHINRHDGLKRGSSVCADEFDLAHVRYIKQTSRFAGLLVLGHEAFGVLHGHGVARKRNHACAQLNVQGVQGGCEQFGTRG